MGIGADEERFDEYRFKLYDVMDRMRNTGIIACLVFVVVGVVFAVIVVVANAAPACASGATTRTVLLASGGTGIGLSALAVVGVFAIRSWRFSNGVSMHEMLEDMIGRPPPIHY